MESLRWRYHPEFRVEVLIDQQVVQNQFRVMPNMGVGHNTFKNYGLLARQSDAGVVCHQLQRPDGANWIPSIDLTQAERFQFWVFPETEFDPNSLAYYASASSVFGQTSLYVNNLNAAGDIDSNLNGNVVSLTSGAAAGNTERAAASSPIIAQNVTAGTYNAIQAGQVLAGAAVSFSETETLTPQATRAGLDLSKYPPAVWNIQLSGGVPIAETVIVDQVFTASQAIAVIEIYRDVWLTPLQPRTYQLNFASI